MEKAKRISMKEFDEVIKTIYEEKPFKMYFHGCNKDSADFIVKNAHSNFNIMRNSIASTVVNGGTIKTDYYERLKNYRFKDSNANLVIIMPDAIKIDKYCGAIEGQVGVTLGYANNIELDYAIMATNETINNRPMSYQDANNCFIFT